MCSYYDAVCTHTPLGPSGQRVLPFALVHKQTTCPFLALVVGCHPYLVSQANVNQLMSTHAFLSKNLFNKSE
jgi:hypothetical protein